MKTSRLFLLISCVLGMGVALWPGWAAAVLPQRLTDGEFWRLISQFSEPDGFFPYENFLSNEITYQSVIPELVRSAKSGGVYLGVGPEQNFTYIAAVQPKIAFIIDIRRQNMIELLMYKALFELSSDRADFVARLFSRKQPTAVTKASTPEQIFKSIQSAPRDLGIFNQNAQAIRDSLVTRHGFGLTDKDQETLNYVLKAFYTFGPNIDYGSMGPSPTNGAPYESLMTLTDENGHNWSYLATEDNFSRVQQLQQRNLIIPLVGDFAGTKTLRAVGQFVKDHGATVTAFYVSNVETYLYGTAATRFRANVNALPTDSTSRFIRFVPWRTTLDLIRTSR